MHSLYRKTTIITYLLCLKKVDMWNSIYKTLYDVTINVFSIKRVCSTYHYQLITLPRWNTGLINIKPINPVIFLPYDTTADAFYGLIQFAKEQIIFLTFLCRECNLH